jgi:hypothetical protein
MIMEQLNASAGVAENELEFIRFERRQRRDA